jgi:hypothetical protein
MLYADEAELTSPVVGGSGFTEQFEKRGPFDKQGRSLRQLELRTRTFRYPLSYLVYSEAFDALPERVKQYAYRRFAEILSADTTDATVARFSREERAATLDILRATKPAFVSATAME